MQEPDLRRRRLLAVMTDVVFLIIQEYTDIHQFFLEGIRFP